MTWDQVNISQYLDITQTLTDEKDDMKKLGRIVKIVFEEDLEDIPLNEMNDKLTEVTELLNTPPQRNKIKKTYLINGKKFRLTDMKHLSMAQFIDATSILKTEDLDLVMNKLLSVFLIPEDAPKYNKGYDLEEIQEDLWHISVQDSNGIAFFVVALLKKQYQRGLVFLIAQTLLTRGMKWKMKKEVIKSLIMGWRAMDLTTF